MSSSFRTPSDEESVNHGISATSVLVTLISMALVAAVVQSVFQIDVSGWLFGNMFDNASSAPVSDDLTYSASVNMGPGLNRLKYITDFRAGS